ncbi:MAG: TonB-dependent receptor [Acidobacteria bacterium]|nr:TonB-dependent receptor [Acidobacteriota bacterium]
MKVVTLLLLSLASGFAQVDTGVIAGTIHDASGAAVPNATVSIRSERTGLSQSIRTNELGRYVSPPLQPGDYQITAEAAGFKRTMTTLSLSLNQRAVVDLTLEVGATEQQITVTAQSAALESENTTIGNIRSENAVRDLPLNGRNFAQLIGLTTGVVPAQTQAQSLALTATRGTTANNVNGAGFRANRFLIDGLDNTENHNGQGVLVNPPVEAIQEFSVQSSVAPAEFGRGGANVNIRLKSGSRDFHGVVFHFLRNSALDARNFFDPPGKTPPFRMNQFGAVFSGPVLVPRLYNGRNKTFFFFDYEGIRTRQAQTFLSTVPTVLFKTGDFSASPNTIYNPYSARQVPAGTERDPFPANRIPTSLIDSTGRNLINIYPDPNAPGIAANYLVNPSQSNAANNWDLKLDHNFSGQDQFFARYSRHITNQNIPGALPAPAWGNTAAGLSRFPLHQFVLSETHLFSSTLINEARAGIGRLFIDARHPNYGVNVADRVGIAGINGGDDVLRSGLSQINVTGFQVLGDSGFRPSIIVSENWQFSDNLSWYRGGHSIKFGGEFMRRRYNLLQTTAAHGIYNITGAFTQNLITAARTGIAAADMLLGIPESGNINALAGMRGYRRSELSLFFQDNWKISQALTLNLGLRYEIFPGFPWMEVYDRQASFLPDRGDVFVVNSKDLPEPSGATLDRNNFGPRAGLAYKLGSRTVLRGAYGIFYQGESVPETNLPGTNPPFTGSVDFVNNRTDPSGARRLSQGFPLPVTTVYPTAGASLFTLEHVFTLPYTQQWNAAIQQQLMNRTVLTASYVGAKGSGLILAPNINQPRPGPGAAGPRRPFPRFGTISEVASAGSSIYHSLQTSLERRMSTGLSFLVSYTYAHAIDNGGFIGDRQDLNNLRAERSNGDTDIRHRFIGSWNWEAPFFKRNFVLGGWQVNGIASLYTGLPFTVSSATNTLNGSGGQRADRLRNGVLPSDQRSIERWFDISAFAVPGQFIFGNAGRNILTGPNTTQLDVSVFKNFPIHERFRLQFRSEFFNIANTPQFNTPAAGIGNPTAGRITVAGSKPTLQRTSRQIQFALKLYW